MLPATGETLNLRNVVSRTRKFAADKERVGDSQFVLPSSVNQDAKYSYTVAKTHCSQQACTVSQEIQLYCIQLNSYYVNSMNGWFSRLERSLRLRVAGAAQRSVFLYFIPPPCFTVFNHRFWRTLPAFLRFSAPPDSHQTDKEANLTGWYFLCRLAYWNLKKIIIRVWCEMVMNFECGQKSKNKIINVAVIESPSQKEKMFRLACDVTTTV